MAHTIWRREGTYICESGVVERSELHGFRVVCAQRWVEPPYRCNGSKQIILANENAGLPAPANVYDYTRTRERNAAAAICRDWKLGRSPGIT